MALPSSGQIGLNAIYTELTGIIAPPGAGISLYNASIGTYAEINPNSPTQPNTTAPYAMSSWYLYDQSAVGSTKYNFGQDPAQDPSDSCIFGPTMPLLELYSNDLSITMGTVFYTDSGLITPFDGGNYWWYSIDNNISYRIDAAGGVVSEQPC